MLHKRGRPSVVGDKDAQRVSVSVTSTVPTVERVRVEIFTVVAVACARLAEVDGLLEPSHAAIVSVQTATIETVASLFTGCPFGCCKRHA